MVISFRAVYKHFVEGGFKLIKPKAGRVNSRPLPLMRFELEEVICADVLYYLPAIKPVLNFHLPQV